MRLLALPVGAHNKIWYSASSSYGLNPFKAQYSWTIAFIIVVLPVPGPPVTILILFVKALIIASFCSGDNSIELILSKSVYY